MDECDKIRKHRSSELSQQNFIIHNFIKTISSSISLNTSPLCHLSIYMWYYMNSEWDHFIIIIASISHANVAKCFYFLVEDFLTFIMGIDFQIFLSSTMHLSLRRWVETQKENGGRFIPTIS